MKQQLLLYGGRMTEDLKSKVWEWFAHLTVKRLIISAVAGAIGIGGWTLWENRQHVFDRQAIKYDGDYKLPPPSADAQVLVQAFVNLRPEIVMVTLLDANPVSNTRNVVHRWFNEAAVRESVERVTKVNPLAGDGALFTSDPENNKQVLAVLSGEFYCAPVSGIILTAYPEVAKRVKYSCRVPLPPAFGKATGWFAVHLEKWPPADMDNFKSLALMMSLTFYNREILKQPLDRPR
jgi:hypothetical protein